MHSRSGKTADFPAHSPGMRAYAYVFGGRPAMNVHPPSASVLERRQAPPLRFFAQKARLASIAERSRANLLRYFALINGFPLAAGTWERPTNNTNTRMVTMKGIIEISCVETTALEPSTIFRPEHMPNSRQAHIAP